MGLLDDEEIDRQEVARLKKKSNQQFKFLVNPYQQTNNKIDISF